MREITSLLARLKRLAKRVPTLETEYPLLAPSFQTGASRDEIADLGADALPADYRFFLSRCRQVSAEDVFNGYFLFSLFRIAAICAESASPRTLHVDGSDGLLTEARVLPIGGDGGGNMFLLETRAGTQAPVWKWCHEYPVRFDGVARKGLTLLAPSFTLFLERIVEDWEHFVASDQSWPYISG